MLGLVCGDEYGAALRQVSYSSFVVMITVEALCFRPLHARLWGIDESHCRLMLNNNMRTIGLMSWLCYGAFC